MTVISRFNKLSCKSYLWFVAFLEVRKQQADKHRALLLAAHKSADPGSERVTHPTVSWGRVNRVYNDNHNHNHNLYLNPKRVTWHSTHLDRMLSSLATCALNFFFLSLSVLRTIPLKYRSSVGMWGSSNLEPWVSESGGNNMCTFNGDQQREMNPILHPRM